MLACEDVNVQFYCMLWIIREIYCYHLCIFNQFQFFCLPEARSVQVKFILIHVTPHHTLTDSNKTSPTIPSSSSSSTHHQRNRNNAGTYLSTFLYLLPFLIPIQLTILKTAQIPPHKKLDADKTPSSRATLTKSSFLSVTWYLLPSPPGWGGDEVSCPGRVTLNDWDRRTEILEFGVGHICALPSFARVFFDLLCRTGTRPKKKKKKKVRRGDEARNGNNKREREREERRGKGHGWEVERKEWKRVQ